MPVSAQDEAKMQKILAEFKKEFAKLPTAQRATFSRLMAQYRGASYKRIGQFLVYEEYPTHNSK